MTGACGALTEGELWVEKDRITCVGAPCGDAPHWDREIDCAGDLLLPAFKNAHTHSAMTFLRSYADNKPLDRWLTEDVFPLEAFLAPDDIYALTQLAILEYVSGGISTGFDMYYHNDAIAAACIDAGFRMVLCGSVNDYGGSADSMYHEYQRFNALHPLISYRLGGHGEYTTSLPLLKSMAELVQQEKAPFFIHNSETRAEVDGCIGRYGKTPMQLMCDLGFWNCGGGGFHCVHCSEADRKIMKEHGIYAILNCGSNLKLASGIAPIYEYDREGVGIAIGTDGPASNNALDMFREMHLVSVLPKLCHGADAMSPEHVLFAACSGGARAMQLHDCDALQPGKQADIVRIGLDAPNMQPPHNLTTNLVYSGSKQNVKMTMVAGRILYEDGTFHVGTDAAVIRKNAHASTQRILAKAGKA